MRLIKDFLHAKKPGGNAVLTVGMGLALFFVTPAALDVPTYFAVQQQLQTATDAAALAAAAKLPDGHAAAEQAAYTIATHNLVAGKTLQPGEMTFAYGTNNQSVTVTSSTQMPTLTAKLMCALQLSQHNSSGGGVGGMGGDSGDGGQSGGETQQENHSVIENCEALQVGARATAKPAARDTVLVIDTSGSMSVRTNGTQLMTHVKNAATLYLDHIQAYNNPSVDRIALVDFNSTARNRVQLTSLQDSPNFSILRSSISQLSAYSCPGWCTNYEVGLRYALDELSARGRALSNKQVIFMTDGRPNLPAPTNYHSYSNYHPYKKCSDIVDNSSAVRALCYRNSRGQRICPALPSSVITDSMISSSATSCAQTYTDYMESTINSQTDRAKQMGVSITTIEIENPNAGDSAEALFRRLLKDPDWDNVAILNYMAPTTKGQQYVGTAYDPAGINDIYAHIADFIHLKLSSIP